MSEDEIYLRLGGWLASNSGWWHPPSCLASWPIDEAVAMAKKDEASGMRMSRGELRAYLLDVGMGNVDSYIELLTGKPPVTT